jgi:hypothetical protein
MVFGVEMFVRRGAVPGETPPEDDLFSGVRGETPRREGGGERALNAGE